MGGGSHVAIPRISKKSNVGLSTTEPPLQEQPSDGSVNSHDAASCHMKEKSPIDDHSFSYQQAHCLQFSSNHVDLHSTELLDPTPLSVIPAGKPVEEILVPIKRCDLGIESSYTQLGVANATHAEYASASRTEDASGFQMALCPVGHHAHMGHHVASMLPIGYAETNTEGHSAGISQNGHLSRVGEANPRTVRDRHFVEIRRDKIAEGIRVLKSCVPYSGTSCKVDEEAVLDDTIDYIKYLKLQLKLLSQSRLSGEPVPYPLVHLEGYGHYLLHERECTDPVEDMMGHLLETNPQAANELIESKGIAILPMDFAYSLLQFS